MDVITNSSPDFGVLGLGLQVFAKCKEYLIFNFQESWYAGNGVTDFLLLDRPTPPGEDLA